MFGTHVKNFTVVFTLWHHILPIKISLKTLHFELQHKVGGNNNKEEY